MTGTRRALAASRVEARQLWRRKRALFLLTALPLAFYGVSAGHDPRAVVVGGIAMAFSLSGAAIFSTLAARTVDQRLVLAGYRSGELQLGRLMVLETFGLAVAAAFSAVMITGSDPPRASLLVAAIVLVALIAVPFGSTLGALLPSELEAVLVMIGVVGIQLSVGETASAGKLLPFWGPRRLLDASLGEQVSTGRMALIALAYGAELLVLTLVLSVRRLRLAPHARGDRTGSSS